MVMPEYTQLNVFLLNMENQTAIPGLLRIRCLL